MMHVPGTRVFAVQSATAEAVYLLGFGVYVGDHPCPIKEAFIESSGETLADLARQQIEHADAAGLFHDAPEKFWADMDAEEMRRGGITQEEADCRPAARAAEAASERARPMEERVAALVHRIAANPRIDLDHGPTVWGIECWWGPEEQWAELAAGRRVHGVAGGGA